MTAHTTQWAAKYHHEKRYPTTPLFEGKTWHARATVIATNDFLAQRVVLAKVATLSVSSRYPHLLDTIPWSRSLQTTNCLRRNAEFRENNSRNFQEPYYEPATPSFAHLWISANWQTQSPNNRFSEPVAKKAAHFSIPILTARYDLHLLSGRASPSAAWFQDESPSSTKTFKSAICTKLAYRLGVWFEILLSTVLIAYFLLDIGAGLSYANIRLISRPWQHFIKRQSLLK